MDERQQASSPDVEEIDVRDPGEPEVQPDIVTDPDDNHVEGVDAAPDARETGEQPPVDAEGPEPGQPAQSKEEVGGGAETAATE
jgi:hypothetical protein